MGDGAGSDMALDLKGAGQPLLALMEVTEREQSETLTCVSGPPSMPHSPYQAPTLAPVQFHSGAKVLMLRGVRKNTEREQNQLAPNPQSFCSSTLGPDPAPDRVLSATEHRRSPGSHLPLTLAPPFQAPPPTKVIATRTN